MNQQSCWFIGDDNEVQKAATSWATSGATRRSMKGNKGRDTVPEVAVRRILHATGLRYRVNYRPVPGLRRTVDIAFTRAKLAVLIDGCFWHGCPEHYTRPSRNQRFWDEKVERNRTRDAETTRVLVEHGWSVIRFWEHVPPDEVARVVIDTVTASGNSTPTIVPP